jgi:hypothetical protein
MEVIGWQEMEGTLARTRTYGENWKESGWFKIENGGNIWLVKTKGGGGEFVHAHAQGQKWKECSGLRMQNAKWKEYGWSKMEEI